MSDPGMRYYPVFLDLAGQPAIVLGGGRIAAEKVASLHEAGAKVTVIASSRRSTSMPTPPNFPSVSL